ncbi:MAG: hypothetical protein AB8G86_02760 [Saprospiraceae bacterium]
MTFDQRLLYDNLKKRSIMAWGDENLSDTVKEKIKDFVWSNLASRRIMAQTADLYTDKILSVIIAMLGGKEPDKDDADGPSEEDNLG